MKVIRDVSGFVGNWASGLLDESIPEGSLSLGVINDKDELIGAVVVTQRSRDNIMIAVCGTSPRWAQRGPLSEMFTALYNELDKTRITCMVSESNDRSLRLTRGLGFREEGRLRQAGSNGEDMILFGMLKEECEYLLPQEPDEIA